MKRLARVLAVVVTGGLTLGLSSTAFAVTTPPTPTECSGMTFTNTKTIVAGDAQAVVGTAGNDLIFAGSASSVNGFGGDDCIVVNAVNNVNGGDGNDVIVVNGWGNLVNAGAGNDKVYDKSPGGQDIRGNDGNDYLSGAGSSTVNGGAGTDECYKGTNGQIKNCELPVSAPAATPVPWWVTMWGQWL